MQRGTLKKIKRPPKVPSASTSRDTRHSSCVPKLHKYHQISSVERKAMCSILGGRFRVAILLILHIVLIQIRLRGLKSHDYHVLMQQLLPIAIQNMGMPNQMVDAIIELCSFFWWLCSKSKKAEDFEKLHTNISPILCKLEEKFSSAFFMVMIHLTVHLAQEARVGGHVHYRYMYPVKRCVYMTYLFALIDHCN